MPTHKKDPKRVEAGKKAARTRKRTPSTRKRTYRRKKTMLSEMWSPAIARNSASAAGSGALGGAAAAIIDNLLDKAPKPPHEGLRIAGLIAAGFGVAALLKAPNMGAGISAIAGYKLMKVTGLAENDDNADYAREIESMPAMLDVHGQPMSENGMYLEEDGMYLEDNAMDLQDGYQVSYAPDFGSPTGV